MDLLLKHLLKRISYTFSYMKLTPEQVRHIAQLARLKLNDEEVEKFSHELTDILDWVEMLNEVDTEGLNGEEGVPESSSCGHRG